MNIRKKETNEINQRKKNRKKKQRNEATKTK